MTFDFKALNLTVKKSIHDHPIPLKNIFFQYLNTAITFIFPLILFPYLTRVLSPEGYGKIGFYEAAFQVVLLISSFGIPYYGIREWGNLAEDKFAKSRLVAHLFLFNVLLSAISIICFVYFMTRPGLVFSNNRLTIYYVLLILFSTCSLDWYFQAEEKFRFIFRRTLLTKIFLLIAVFVFVRNEADFTKYVFITLIIYIMIAITSVVMVLKNVLTKDYLRHFRPGVLLKKLSAFAGLGILAGFYINVDTLILGHYADTASIGYYTVANKVARMVIAVLVSTTIVFFARIVSADNRQHQNSQAKIQQYSLTYLFHICLPAATLVWFFGTEIITVLSGNAFMPAIQLLPYFSLIIVIVALHDFFVIQVLLSQRQEKKVFWLMLAASIISFALNLLLIKIYGMKGAVISVLITECIVLAGSVWLSKGIFTFSPQIQRQFLSSLMIIPITYITAILAKKFILPPMIILVSGALISFGIYCLVQLYLFRNVFFVEMRGKLIQFLGANKLWG